MRQPTVEDAGAIAAIESEGLATGDASFRDAASDWSGFETRFMSGGGLALLVEQEGSVLAWAGVSPTSTRAVYRGVGEVSVYVSTKHQMLGVGRHLLQTLVHESENVGFWTLVAHVFPENKASLSLHKAAGFRIVGIREKLGQMTYGPRNGQWRDVAFLERRSTRIG